MASSPSAAAPRRANASRTAARSGERARAPLDGGPRRAPSVVAPSAASTVGERRGHRGDADPRRGREAYRPGRRGAAGCRARAAGTRPSTAMQPRAGPADQELHRPEEDAGDSAAATSTPVTTASTAFPRATASRAACATCASEATGCASRQGLLLLVVAHDDAAARPDQSRPPPTERLPARSSRAGADAWPR